MESRKLPNASSMAVLVQALHPLQRRTTYKVSFLGGRVPLDLGFRGPSEAKSFVRGRKIEPPGAPGRVFDLKCASCGHVRSERGEKPKRLRTAAMASVGMPPAASQGEHEDVFNHIKVATYNVGASQDCSFTAHGKKEHFKFKLLVTRARLAVGPASTTQKAFREAGPIRREGPGPSRRGPSGGGY